MSGFQEGFGFGGSAAQGVGVWGGMPMPASLDPFALGGYWARDGPLDEVMHGYRNRQPPKVVYCLSQHDCFNKSCTYAHPNGICNLWESCVSFDCAERHGRFRIRCCKDKAACERVACIFLHPSSRKANMAANKKEKSQHQKLNAKAKAKGKVAKAGIGRAVKLGPLGLGSKFVTKLIVKECGVCATRLPQSSFKKWRWASSNADACCCNTCCKRYSCPFDSEADMQSHKPELRRWVIESKQKLGLTIIDSVPAEEGDRKSAAVEEEWATASDSDEDDEDDEDKVEVEESGDKDEWGGVGVGADVFEDMDTDGRRHLSYA